MSTAKTQSLTRLRAHINGVPAYKAFVSEADAAACLNDLGGLLGSWRTDYSECTYFYPQRIDGRLVDLGSIEDVRRFHESIEHD